MHCKLLAYRLIKILIKINQYVKSVHSTELILIREHITAISVSTAVGYIMLRIYLLCLYLIFLRERQSTQKL